MEQILWFKFTTKDTRHCLWHPNKQSDQERPIEHVQAHRERRKRRRHVVKATDNSRFTDYRHEGRKTFKGSPEGFYRFIIAALGHDDRLIAAVTFVFVIAWCFLALTTVYRQKAFRFVMNVFAGMTMSTAKQMSSHRQESQNKYRVLGEAKVTIHSAVNHNYNNSYSTPLPEFVKTYF